MLVDFVFKANNKPYIFCSEGRRGIKGSKNPTLKEFHQVNANQCLQELLNPCKAWIAWISDPNVITLSGVQILRVNRSPAETSFAA